MPILYALSKVGAQPAGLVRCPKNLRIVPKVDASLGALGALDAVLPFTAAALAEQFSRAKDKEVAEILETLAALGRAHEGDAKGTYVR